MADGSKGRSGKMGEVYGPVLKVKKGNGPVDGFFTGGRMLDETYALDGREEEHPPAKKKMWLLPQEEVDWILAQSNEPVPTEFRELKRANPSLVPSPEEEKDESTMLLYACVRNCYEEEAKFAKFQAWVRGEHARKGFVEVDYDYFGESAEVFRLNDEAREEVMGHWDHPSDTDDDDEDWKLFIREIRRTFV